MITFSYGLILGLVISSVGFTVYLYMKSKELKQLTRTVIEIQNGFINQRFRVHFFSNSLTHFCIQLNKLMDHYQKTTIKYEKLEKIQKQMLSNISHDLRTPLTGIIGYIESVLEDKTMERKEIDEHLHIAHKKGLNLSKILQQFFEYVKLEAEEQPLPFERLNVTELVKETALLFIQQFEEKQMTPKLLLPNEAIFVNGHAPSLERIVSNLIQNALTYGHHGKEIGVKLEQEDQEIRIEIWDRGKGIPAADLSYIFERLYTGIPSRNRTLQGSGLGLAITKLLVEKHHGTIEVTSIPDVKTSFIFHLPAKM
jgi:signal transduction histidine kinase